MLSHLLCPVGSLLICYEGLSLREMIHEFKHQTLVLFKGLLLQPKVCRHGLLFRTQLISKMLFFGTRCERLCMIQFSLVSLIPGLINALQDCADPSFDYYAQNVEKPTSLKTSDRGSCEFYVNPICDLRLISEVLAYMGLPLQIFGKVCI